MKRKLFRKNIIGTDAQPKRKFIFDAAHILVLWSFAVAQPLFDVLARNAEFFFIRRSEPLDIFLFVLVLCVFLPFCLILIEMGAGWIGPKVRGGVHFVFTAVLVAAIFLPLLKTISGVPGAVSVAGSVTIGTAATFAYCRIKKIGTFITVLLPALLIFPGLFLFNSPVARILLPAGDPAQIAAEVKNPIPIVFIIFDELTLTALMDEHNRVDPVRYPHFAALSAESYWFRNFTTVADQTHNAIPAALTGMYPDNPRQPVATDHPKHLFTLLGSTYDLVVFEPITRLCPDRLCEREGGLHGQRR